MSEMLTEHITKAQGVLLALHAIHVQGGVSDPQREAERAEKDIAAGGTIDFAKMAAELADAAVKTEVDKEIAEAAELEGLAPMPADLVPLREEKLAIDRQVEVLNARLKEIKDTFGARLEADGLQGYVLNAKVHARATNGTRTTVDSKELKAKMPHIWSQFLKVTKYRSISIS